MKKKTLFQKKRTRILAAVFLGLVITAGILYLARNPIVRFLYHHRFMAGVSAGTGSDSGYQTRILNFDFSLRDMEYFGSATEGRGSGKRQSVELSYEGKNYSVDMFLFDNYFLRLPLYGKQSAFGLRFPEGGLLDENITRFDLFRLKDPDFFEQELIYRLGRRLGLYIPWTDYADVFINFADYGDYTLKQAFDDQFLEQNQIPDGIIFMLHQSEKGKLTIKQLYNESQDKSVEKHLDRFPELLEKKDPNLLLKYFDSDYLARFEALRKLLKVGHGFFLQDNLRYIYNKVNGKIYPILDESNIANMISPSKNPLFQSLHAQTASSPILKRSSEEYLFRLGEQYNDIFSQHRQAVLKFKNLSYNLFYRLRLHLVSDYFHINVYSLLRKNYHPARLLDAVKKGNVAGVKELLEAGAPVSEEVLATAGTLADKKIPALLTRQEKSPVVPQSRLTRSQTYLDQMLLPPHLFFEKHDDLALVYDQEEAKIIMGPGEYILNENMTVPIGQLLEIRAGTTLRIGPKVSLISYSPIHIAGTELEPVVITARDQDLPFGVVAVIGGGGMNRPNRSDRAICKINYLDFSGAGEAVINGVKHSGGMNVYDIDTDIMNSSFHHNHADAGLSIKNSTLLLEDNQFHDNFSDQLVLEFCKGSLHKNSFYNSGKDSNGDGASIKASEIWFGENVFRNISDKGASISKQSEAIFYRNRFIRTRVGIASRDRGRILVWQNHFEKNIIAAAAFMRRAPRGGGKVYLVNNTFIANKRLFQVDRFSKLYRLQNRSQVEASLSRPLMRGNTPRLFQVFKNIRETYQYKDNSISSFSIGDTPALIDETNKIIFAALPNGASVRQMIRYTVLPDTARATLTPTAYGSRSVNPAEVDEIPLPVNNLFDFKEYLFRGQLTIQYDFQVDTYELIVTTGTVPIVEIDTRNRAGVVREIKNEPKIPTKIRFFFPPGFRATDNSTTNSPKTPDAAAAMDATNTTDTEADGENEKSFQHRYLDGRIEGRGRHWEKWKYGLILEKPIKLGNLLKGRRWVLESCYVEKSLMRPKVSFDLFDRFREPHWKRIAPRSIFVEIILNGDYQGVYLLMEHIDSDFLKLEDFDKTSNSNALMFRAAAKNANFTRYNNPDSLFKKYYEDYPGGIQPIDKEKDSLRGWASGFEQRHPAIDRYGEHWQPLKEFVSFVALASDEDFRNNIFDRLDIDRFINLWIFMQVVDDSDGLYQNRYLVREKDKESKWFFVPWDKDGVMGRDYKMDKRSYSIWLRTNLFNRCMEIRWFRDALRKTWDSLLVNGIISEDAIFKMIDANVVALGDAPKRNFTRWSIDPAKSPYPDGNTFEQEIVYLKSWIRHRIQFLYNWMIRIHNPENH